MRDPFDCLLLFLTGLVLWMWILSGPPAKAEEVQQAPRITLEHKDDFISYCYAEQHNVYLPCMYSSKVYDA